MSTLTFSSVTRKLILQILFWQKIYYTTYGILYQLPYCFSLISDNGCQPTSQRFMMNCSILGIKQIFTTWSNPKGNSDTERVMRTIKEDLVWCYDWDNPFDFEIALHNWVEAYNADYPHQALNNMTPRQCYEAYVNERPKTTELVLT